MARTRERWAHGACAAACALALLGALLPGFCAHAASIDARLAAQGGATPALTQVDDESDESDESDVADEAQESDSDDEAEAQESDSEEADDTTDGSVNTGVTEYNAEGVEVTDDVATADDDRNARLFVAACAAVAGAGLVVALVWYMRTYRPRRARQRVAAAAATRRDEES